MFFGSKEQIERIQHKQEEDDGHDAHRYCKYASPFESFPLLFFPVNDIKISFLPAVFQKRHRPLKGGIIALGPGRGWSIMPLPVQRQLEIGVLV